MNPVESWAIVLGLWANAVAWWMYADQKWSAK